MESPEKKKSPMVQKPKGKLQAVPEEWRELAFDYERLSNFERYAIEGVDLVGEFSRGESLAVWVKPTPSRLRSKGGVGVQRFLLSQSGRRALPAGDLARAVTAVEVHSRHPVTRRVREIQGEIGSTRNSLEEISGTVKWLRSLEKGWDGEEAEPINEKYIEQAESLLKSWAYAALTHFANRGGAIEPPKARPTTDSTIDLHWKTDSYELIVNIGQCGEKTAVYYGDDYDSDRTEGTFPIDKEYPTPLLWLIFR